MTSLTPIDPDLVAVYQARVVALAADFLVAILAAGPRSAEKVGTAADAALLTRRAVHQAAKALRLRRRAGWRLPGPKTARGRQARRDPLAGPALAARQ
jgi:hypothetical protein